MIAITGGGTGGHLMIAAALKEALNHEGIKPIYIGSTTGQDQVWFGNDDGYAARYFLPTRGVVNQRGLGKLLSLGATAKATLKARGILGHHDIRVVFSVGGYSAAPASLAALLSGKKLFIHEQNAIRGRLNNLLYPFAVGFFSAFEESSPCPGYPVRSIFFEMARTRCKVESIIFLGGSQGAKGINDFALAVAPELARRGIQIIHQAGRLDVERVQAAYAAMGISADCFAFDPHLVAKIARADLAVSRAGASTLFELAANGLPALFIPFPYAAGDHQYYNARYLTDRGLGWVVRQEHLTPEDLYSLLDRSLDSISVALRGLVAPDNAVCIAKKLMDAVGRT
ncbi:MAG: UDP-N-acetylglucosamine--N-acetylmuramyl-(pentapeptide) pyrophosphoryl-undecaprenol N-acetylglucosamine transferase [Campylobacterales bacterium]